MMLREAWQSKKYGFDVERRYSKIFHHRGNRLGGEYRIIVVDIKKYVKITCNINNCRTFVP